MPCLAVPSHAAPCGDAMPDIVGDRRWGTRLDPRDRLQEDRVRAPLCDPPPSRFRLWRPRFGREWVFPIGRGLRGVLCGFSLNAWQGGPPRSRRMKDGRLVWVEWEGRRRPRRDVILELEAAGVPVGEIARLLDVRYQIVYMTLHPQPSVRTDSPPAPSRRRRWRTDRPPDAVLLGCVSQKNATPMAAKDLYRSELFRRRRLYAEASGAPWWIVSAEYGLVRPRRGHRPLRHADHRTAARRHSTGSPTASRPTSSASSGPSPAGASRSTPATSTSSPSARRSAAAERGSPDRSRGCGSASSSPGTGSGSACRERRRHEPPGRDGASARTRR